MDILKELFGTSDELQINKSLFGNEVEHGDINLDQSHGLSRESVQHPLPVLPPLRPSTNPPPLPLLPVEPRPHNLPLVRSHSLENVHSRGGASEEKDLLRNYRSDSQSTFTQFNTNTCTATAHVDLHSVPQEMPMYLLQEDEGNDEEIMRLMGASREASSRGDSPSDSGSGDDVVVAETQVDGLCVGERCPSSVQDSTSEDVVSDGNLAFVISNPIGSVDMTEDVNHTLANEFQLLVDTATNEVTIGDEDINDAGCLVDDVISEIDIGKLDTGISSLLGLTATTTAAPTAFTSLGRSSEVMQMPGTASVDAEVNARALSKSTSNSIPTTTLSAGQLHPSSGGPSQDLHYSARTAGISKSFNSESFPAAKAPSVATASNTLLNSDTIRERLWTTTAVSMQPTSQHVHPASTSALKSNRVMVNEGTQTTTGIHLQRKRTLASTQCLASSSTSEKQVTKATKQLSSTRSYSTSAQQLTAFTTAVRRVPAMVSSATVSSDSSVPPLVNTIATDSTSSSPAAHFLASSSVAPCLTSCPAAPALTSSSAAPIPTSNPVVPIFTSSPVAPTFTSSPVVSIPTSMPAAPILTSSSAAPNVTNSPVAPILTNSSAAPNLTNSPAAPILTSSSAAPNLTNSSAAPILTSIPAAPPFTSSSTAPTLTGSPSPPILQSTPPVEPLLSTLPNLDSLLQRTLLTLSSTSAPSLSASSVPTSTASAQLTTSVANSARLQLARSLLNLSIPTIIPLSVSGSSEPAIAVPLPRSLVSLACMSQCSPVASEAQHGGCRSESKILPKSASVDTRRVALPKPRNAAKHDVKSGVVEPLTVLEDVPRGLSSLAGSIADSTSNKQHCTKSLQNTAAVSLAISHHIDSCASHLDGNCAAALTIEKNPRTASTEVRPTSPEMQIEKEGEMPVILTSESLDVPNSLNTHTSTVIKHGLTTPLQGESEPNPPKGSTPACVTVPNAITLLSRHEDLSSRPNHTTSPRLSPASQGHQDSSSSNSKLMVSPTFSLQIPVMDPRSNQLSHRILGLAATPVEVVHIPSHQREAQDEDSHRKKKRRHGGGWPKGKRRKMDDEPKPPKPPSTGYRLFLSDKWSEVQRETGMQSIPHLSKKLGHMWSALRKEEKESYGVRADLDRKRYLEELKVYLENLNEENLTIHESLDTFLSQIFENETNDNVLVCRLCKLTFTSLHNKRCHYSSKAHTDTLWQELNTLLGRNKGKQMKGKKARSSIARSSVVVPTEVVHTPQPESSAPVDVSLDTNGETQTGSATVVDIDCSEVEVGMYDEAADKTMGDSGRVSRTSEYGDVHGRVDMSECETLCIQSALVPNGATVETATVPEVSISPSEAIHSPSPSLSAAPSTSNSVHIDTCTNTLSAPINALSLPISATSSEDRMWSVDGGSVVREEASALHRSRSVLLEHCESVSTNFKECASRTTSNMQALYGQRKLYSESLNEYSTLQQQCEELEYFSSCYEEELDRHSLEGNNLGRQLVNLLPLFKCTGDTMLVSKLESAYALMDETNSR